MISFRSCYINDNWVAINIDEPRERYKMKEGILESIIFYNKNKNLTMRTKILLLSIYALLFNSCYDTTPVPILSSHTFIFSSSAVRSLNDNFLFCVRLYFFRKGKSLFSFSLTMA